MLRFVAAVKRQPPVRQFPRGPDDAVPGGPGDGITRRRMLGGAMLGAAALGGVPLRGSPAFARIPSTPSAAPFDHVVLLMMENRSFDHFLGWLPGANGRQAGLAYPDTKGTVYPTYHLAPDWQGCGYADPDHSWQAGIKQLNGGRCDGFLKTAVPGDTFPIGYYDRADMPVLSRLAEEYTVSDNYFCSILAETFPNRFYQHAATTDRDDNYSADSARLSTLPTIWDKLTGGLTGTYYFSDEPFLGLWGTRYTSITKPVSQFLQDCQSGNLPNVAFVDPAFGQSLLGTSDDDHPHGDIRSGDAFIAEIYHAVRQSPLWDRTVFVISFDEWGGFFDHVSPPRVTDDTVNPAPGPHPDYRQLGFRVPNVVISPYSPRGRIVRGGAPFEHTSLLKMIEWRWGLRPLTARDANARNLAEMLDFSQRRTDKPDVPSPAFPAVVPCGPTSHPASPPAPVSVMEVPLGPTQTLTVRYYGRRHALGGILVEVNTNFGTMDDITIELRRKGQLVSRGVVKRVTPTRRHLVLTRSHHRRFPLGRYTLVTRTPHKTLARREVRVGKRGAAT